MRALLACTALLAACSTAPIDYPTVPLMLRTMLEHSARHLIAKLP
jgi:hypothetical protein